MAVVIGKRAARVPASRAMEHVFGYINFIDGSARGLPPPGNVFFQMKSRDTFAPIGPWLVTADEIADPHALQVRLSVNGAVKQNFNTSDMAHKIPRCIEWVSAIHTLEPGDILATGTNHRGLSAFQDGDTVELETAGLGRLALPYPRRAETDLGPGDAARPAGEGVRYTDTATGREIRPQISPLHCRQALPLPSGQPLDRAADPQHQRLIERPAHDLHRQRQMIGTDRPECSSRDAR